MVSRQRETGGGCYLGVPSAAPPPALSARLLRFPFPFHADEQARQREMGGGCYLREALPPVPLPAASLAVAFVPLTKLMSKARASMECAGRCARNSLTNRVVVRLEHKVQRQLTSLSSTSTCYHVRLHQPKPKTKHNNLFLIQKGLKDIWHILEYLRYVNIKEKVHRWLSFLWSKF